MEMRKAPCIPTFLLSDLQDTRLAALISTARESTGTLFDTLQWFIPSMYISKRPPPPICSVRITVLLLAIGEMGYRRSTASQNQPTTLIVKGTIGMCDVS